jgi:acyl-CoA thioester hydrolase
MAEPFRLRIKVRPYEVDMYGHLTGAVYIQYADYARWSCARAAGVPFDRMYADRVGPVNLQTTIRYHRELIVAEEIDVTAACVYGDGKTFEARQEFLRVDGTLVAEVTSICGMFDLEERRLRPDPAAIWRSYAEKPELMGL